MSKVILQTAPIVKIELTAIAMPSRSIPDIQIVPVQARPNAVLPGSIGKATSQPRLTVEDLRSLRVEEFLMARSLSAKTRKAYEQDLKRFLEWTDTSWAESKLNPRQYGDETHPLNIVAITDGARVIRQRLLTIFGVAVNVLLDWYHLCKKLRQLMSMIAINKSEKTSI